MKSRSVNVAVICPSLDKDRAKKTLMIAARTAGVPTELLVCHDKNAEGFTKTVNAGLETALGLDISHVCILNDDTNPDQPGWLARLVQALDSNPKFGIAGPSGDCRSEPQRYGKPGMPKGVKIVAPYNMAFFAVVIKREVLDQIGVLEKSLIHYGSDNDFCLRADKAGWKIVWVQDVYIKHAVGAVQHKWKALDRVMYNKLWGGGGMPKVIVYTALYGAYDTLRDQPRNPQVNYVCFGDAPQPSKTWKFIKQTRRQPSIIRDARQCKILSHHYITKDVYCMWVDANLVLWDDPVKICTKWLAEADMAVFRHPHRDCIYDEIDACIRLRKGKPDIMRRQVARYKAEGYPVHAGLASTGFIARRQTEDVRKFNDTWWAEVLAGSYRDQLSFPYVAWKTGIKLQVVPGSIRNHIDCPHKPYKGR